MLKMRMRVLSVVFLCICLIGCATGKFARYRGRALRLGIPIYQGVPPQEYSYKSLGYVEGEYKMGFWARGVVVAVFNALEDMANNAVSVGANAVIKVKLSSVGRTYYYTGEAVIFDKFPD